MLPFAYLLSQQSGTVLSLLENLTVPGRSGRPPQPALQVLLSHWCDFAGDFQGYWNQKVFSVALAELYSLAAQRASLQQVQVKGDLLLTAANTSKIMTRARARASACFLTHLQNRLICLLTAYGCCRSGSVPADPVPGQGSQAPSSRRADCGAGARRREGRA